MPLTEIQKEVLRLLAHNRSPDSHLAGGSALIGAGLSERLSRDIDLFHDTEEMVLTCATKDCDTLRQADFSVTVINRFAGMVRAVVTRDGNDELLLDWAYDSAWRFFPVIEDPDLGWRLHDADLATNKVLAMGGRTETRDLLDAISLHERYLPLWALVWAAAGKDPGFTPEFLVEQMRRNARIVPAELQAISLHPIDPVELKRRWLTLMDETESELGKAEDESPGSLYLDRAGKPVWPKPDEFAKVKKHEPSLRGCWPVAR